MKRLAALLAILLAACGPAWAAQPPLRIAVAANFAEAARELAALHAREGGPQVRISSGATGALYAQIRHGAPFDLLLAADAATPRRLVAEGLGEADTLVDYAQGRLVLWSRDPARVADAEALLRRGDLAGLVIANPELAPYGAAAREVLQHLGRWEALAPGLVLAENVGQAMQFVATGAAPFGLVPRALALQAERAGPGAGWDVPTDWHAAIVQSAVVLRHGRDRAEARAFLRWLAGPEAQARIRALGYD